MRFANWLHCLLLIVANATQVYKNIQLKEYKFPERYECPQSIDIQDPIIGSSFNLKQFVGTKPYYELALHDYTQPNTAGCQRSYKSFSSDITNPIVINDNFTFLLPWTGDINQPTTLYKSDLSFNATSQPGVLNGYWAVTPNTVYPDTVVAFGAPYLEGDDYRWVIEFQCVSDDDNMAVFIGVNFYSRNNLGYEAEKSYVV